jgi:hypothetical protein
LRFERRVRQVLVSVAASAAEIARERGPRPLEAGFHPPCSTGSKVDTSNDELTGTLQDGQLRLTWTPVPGVAGYWVYGAGNEPFFVPGFAPAYEHRLVVLPPWIRVWTSADGIGDPSTNWTYTVMATDASEQELARSNRVGEVDYLSDIP